MIKKGILYLWLGLSLPLSALPCNCEEPANMQAALDQAQYAFVGTMIRTNTNWISGGWKFSFKVEKSWKKPVETLLIINTPWKQDCGYEFEEGKRYLVFVERKFSPKTYACKGNRELEEGEEAILADLGKGYEPQTNKLQNTMFWTIGILGALSIIFMAIVIFGRTNKKTQ